MSLPSPVESPAPAPVAEAPPPHGKPSVALAVAWFAVVHGAGLLAFALLLRTLRLLGLEPAFTAADWGLALAPELGLVLLLESVLALAVLGLQQLRPDLRWRGALRILHLVLFTLLVVDHQFFLKTGGGLRASEALYTLGNLQQLTGLLGTGLDWFLGMYAALALALHLLACALERRQPKAPAGFNLRPVALTGVLLGLGLMALLRGSSTALPVRSAALVDVLSSALPIQRFSEFEGLDAIYRRPSLELGTPARRPDIVMVVVESTRAEAIERRAGDASPPPMPFLASLAERSLVVENAYTTIPHTSKALVGLMCGMYPRIQMQISEARPGQLPLTCLPHLLRALGYRTAFMQTALGRFENRPGLAGNLGFEEVRTQEHLGTSHARTGYLGMDEFAMLEPALEWMEAAGNKPSFLALLTVTAHHPYEVPNQRVEPQTPELERYRRSLGHVDGFIAQLHSRLTQAGVLDRDTLLIVVGDHGEAFGEHQRRQHDVVPYEEVLRVPWIVHGPEWLGVPRRIGGLRSHLDLVPSVLDWLGVNHDGQLPGRPLSDPAGHDAVMSSCWYDNYCAALRVGDHKFVYHYDRSPPEVYDLASDPREQTNLAERIPPEHVDAAIEEMLRIRAAADVYYGLLPTP